ncbi:MAG: hypothetical protein ACI814_004937, partial [Mariniblastus sp.]
TSDQQATNKRPTSDQQATNKRPSQMAGNLLRDEITFSERH